jgi:hypothetical protein
MAGNSGKRGLGLGGNRLTIAIGAWLVLVVAGVLCIYFGWFNRPGATVQPTAQPTPTAVVMEPTVARVETVAVELAATVTPLPAPTAPPEIFGYGIALNGVGGGPTDFFMGQVKNLGLGWVKQQVKWADFELAAGEMNWGPFDAVVDNAQLKGLKVMFSVVDAPAWARTSYTDDNVQGAPPDDIALFADFLARLVDRYKGRIHAIEVWNEQNLDREWDTAEGVSPERYVEMLTLAYQTIKSRDPNIIVISGALSPAAGPLTDPNNSNRVTVMDDFVYMERMIAAGLLNVCDCVGAHHNGINLPPDKAWDEGYNDPTAAFRGPFDNPHHSWSFKSTLWGYHDRIVAAGSDKPLCITEFGWASAEGFEGYPPGFEFSLDNTLQEQAQWDVQAFQLMREWGFVRLAFLWNLNYSQMGWGPEDPNAPYALVDFKGAPRPAYDAIGAMPKP